jgi:hypothetical protein
VGVFRETVVASVVDADNDQRLNFAGFNGGVGVLAYFPGAARNERGSRVE